MKEKYLITFEQLKEICVHRRRVCDDCWHIDNKTVCIEKYCPVFEKLERPSITITPVRGK